MKSQFTWPLLVCISTIGCVSAVPDYKKHPGAYEDAIGSVTISSPVASPMVVQASDEKQLHLDKLYDEEALVKMILTPSMASSITQFKALRIAVQGSYAGPNVSSTNSRSSSSVRDNLQPPSASISRSAQETITQETPDVPTANHAIGGSQDEVLAELLGKISFQHSLAPDQLATLVAAYKTYMVNLEEYYNYGSFQATIGDGDRSEYLPYKVHFSVTSEPGWYTRSELMDAVVEGRFGEEGSDDFRVLTVTPAETAQAIDEFSSSMSEFLLSAGLTGSGGPAALDIKLSKIDKIAKRLQGLSTNKTLTVGYPSASSFRVRFRAHRTPTLEGKDQQPISRILTAIVLVKKGSVIKAGSSISLGALNLRNQAFISSPGKECQHTQVPAEPEEGSETTIKQEETLTFQTLDLRGPSFREEPERQAMKVSVESRTGHFFQRGYFAPALRTKDGKFVGTYVRDNLYSIIGIFTGQVRPAKRRWYPKACQELSEASFELPIWLGDAAKDLTASAKGNYALDPTDSLGLLAKVARAKLVLDAAKAKQTTSAADLKAKQAAHSKAAAALAKTPEDPALVKAEAEAKKALVDSKKLNQANSTAFSTAKITLATAEVNEQASWSVALANGQASVHYSIKAPRYILSSGRRKEVEVWGRVRGAQVSSKFQKLGSGDREGTLQLSNLNLGNTALKTTPASLLDFAKKPLALTLEVGLFDCCSPTPEIDKAWHSVVKEFQIYPQTMAPAAAAKVSEPSEPKKAPASSPKIQLDLGQIELKLQGKPSAVPAPVDPKKPE